ncbi:MAG: hypothetical protein GY822_04510 [Deltaproteobacteria bacterium]|nr:hypothetical protein [Deltaproteobacteria bacterium]
MSNHLALWCSRRRQCGYLGVIAVVFAFGITSCATSSQPPKQASPELLSRLTKERDALKKQVRAPKSSTSSSRKTVKRMLGTTMYPKTGIGALNADPKKVIIRWQTVHAKVRLRGSLRVGSVNESGAPASIILKKGKK